MTTTKTTRRRGTTKRTRPTGFTIRTEDTVLAELDTYGEALAWANAHPEVRNVAILWGNKGSGMSMRDWAIIANNTVRRLEDPSRLLANDGTC